jgi:adenine-specific DNA-methyltransferase
MLESSVAHKQAWGQYFTPPALASFMADLAARVPGRRVRVLDPGAGTGALGLALARELLERGSVECVELYCVESEPHAHRELERSLAAAKAEFGDRLEATSFTHDFLDFAEKHSGLPQIDVAIANPPYFKLSPNDERGGDAPNIYARFMDIAATLLGDGGRLCFVVPRSYASGPYFRRFRRRFHESMQLEQVHVFESRRAAFERDAVLQENIVVSYAKRLPQPGDRVEISVSHGLGDLHERRRFDVARTDVIGADADAVVSLPTTPTQLQLVRRIQALPHTLATLDLQVSTGPIVPFRATQLLADADCKHPTVPLLWLQHVKRGRVTWPLGSGFRKPERVRSGAGKLLVPTANYVVLRRFSAKEEPRRLTAAPLLARDWPTTHIGLENHLNYIHRAGAGLSVEEARGLAAVLNSRVLDEYIRVVSGNTQVSATELRALPLPTRQFIVRLGKFGDDEEKIERLLAELLDEQHRGADATVQLPIPGQSTSGISASVQVADIEAPSGAGKPGRRTITNSRL